MREIRKGYYPEGGDIEPIIPPFKDPDRNYCPTGGGGRAR